MIYFNILFHLLMYFGTFILVKSNCLDVEDYEIISLKENHPQGSAVLNFNKTGTVTSASITESSNNPTEFFEIDVNAGTLKLIKSYDYENKKKHLYSITKISYICEGNSFELTTGIYISFSDVDDTQPKWHPEMAYYNGTIKESAAVDTSVILDQELEIKDPELSSGVQNIEVTIVPGLNSNYFYLASSKGVKPKLNLKQPLDYDKIQQINLTLNVEDIERDTKESKFNVTCLVVINVINEDLKPPKFLFANYYGNLTSTTPNNTVVTLDPENVQAKDQDIIDPQEVKYSIEFQSKSESFRIDSVTGVIYLNVDNPEVFNHELVVKAEQKNDTTKSATAKVFISVVTPPGVMPVFSPDLYTLSMREDRSVNDDLVELVTTPRDPSLVYTIENFAGFFYIEKNSGTRTYLRLKSSLNYENPAHRSFNVSIKATKESKNIFATVIVTVVDVNDNTPRFIKTSYEFQAKQRVVGYVVGEVVAVDLDESDTVSYSLVTSVNSQFFSIGSSNGQIKIAKETTNKEYAITAEAKDNRSPVQSTSVNIVVMFDPINSTTTDPINRAGIDLIPLVPILAVVAVVAIVVCVVIIVCYKKRMRSKANAKRAFANLNSSQLSLTDHWATSTQANPLSGFPIGREFENGSYLGDIYSGDRDIGEIQIDETYENLPNRANGFHGKNGSIRTMSTASIGSHPKLAPHLNFPQKLGVAPNGVEVVKAENAIDTGSIKGSDKIRDINIYY